MCATYQKPNLQHKVMTSHGNIENTHLVHGDMNPPNARCHGLRWISKVSLTNVLFEVFNIVILYLVHYGFWSFVVNNISNETPFDSELEWPFLIIPKVNYLSTGLL